MVSKGATVIAPTRVNGMEYPSLSDTPLDLHLLNADPIVFSN